MPTPLLSLTDEIPPDLQSRVIDGLNAFNDQAAGFADRRPLAVVASDPDTNGILGGAIGRSSLGLLFLDLLYLPESCRGTGIGSEILGRFEAEGRRRGCRTALLYTLSFQAPAFYERHGWRRFGEFPCLPEGASRIFLSKQL